MSASKTKWVRLGDYIELCDERNSDGKYRLGDVRGISNQKELIPTKADMNGVSLTSYKIVNSNDFAYVADTSRRGDKIALALNTTDKPILISSIYTTFRSKDKHILLSEYLYMLLSRSEFDRYARFNSWGSARETFDWDEMCRMEIPLPSIEVQQELVDTYNGLKQLAEDNEALVDPLTQACEAMIVDCKKKYKDVALGEYIEEVTIRVGENNHFFVRGINLTLGFVPTVANMATIDTSKYKVVPKEHFACNLMHVGRDVAIPIAYNDMSDNIAVSPAYYVFHIKNNKTEKILSFLFLLPTPHLGLKILTKSFLHICFFNLVDMKWTGLDGF